MNNSPATTGIRYPLPLLRAVHRGLVTEEVLLVTAVDSGGHEIAGRVVCMGSLLTVVTTEGAFVEDIRPEWVTAANVVGWSNR